MRPLVDTLDVSALLMTYVELLPAEDRDLTDLLKFVEDIVCLSGDVPPGVSRRYGELWRYLRSEVVINRVSEWQTQLVEIATLRPSLLFAAVMDDGFPSLLKAAYDAP